jgi:hypothetical protein
MRSARVAFVLLSLEERNFAEVGTFQPSLSFKDFHQAARLHLGLGIKPDTRIPNPKNPNLNLISPNSKNLKSNLGITSRYPKFYSKFRVQLTGTRIANRYPN